MLSYLFSKTPLLFLTQSFWRDEAFTYLLANRSMIDIITLTASDFNPPLYYLIIHFWIKVFGQSEIALRLYSLIMYFGTIYVAYLFLANIFKFRQKKAFYYLFFIAINPILVYCAFEARMYSMLAFLGTLSFYALLRNNRKTYIVSTILGLYTHYFMVFVVLIQAIYRIIIHDKKLKKEYIKMFLVPSLVFIPWLLIILKLKNLSNESFWISKVTATTLIQLVGIVYTGYESAYTSIKWPISQVSVVLTSIIVLSAVYLIKKHRFDNKTGLLLGLWGIGIPLLVFAVSIFKPIFLSRYFIFSSVGLSLLLIHLLDRLPVTAKVMLIAFIVAVTFRYHMVQIKVHSKSNIRRTVTEIKNLAKKEDVIYVTNELDFFPAQYYFHEEKVFVYGKQYEHIPSFVGKILIPKSKFVNNLPIYPKKAFILKSDSHYEIQSIR